MAEIEKLRKELEETKKELSNLGFAFSTYRFSTGLLRNILFSEDGNDGDNDPANVGIISKGLLYDNNGSFIVIRTNENRFIVMSKTYQLSSGEYIDFCGDEVSCKVYAGFKNMDHF